MAIPGPKPDHRGLERRGCRSRGGREERRSHNRPPRYGGRARRVGCTGAFAFAECRGSNALFSDGAGVLWDVPRFVEAVAPELAPRKMPITQDATAGAEPAPAELPEKEAAALAGVGFEPTGVDVVAQRVASSGVEMRELLSALALLELKGYVSRDAGGAFVRTPISNSSVSPSDGPRETS